MGIVKPSKEIIFAETKIKEAWKRVIETDEDLSKQLTRAKDNIKENAFCGRSVIKKLIPKIYTRKYKINNLWIYDLPSGWRLLYTITAPNKIEIISVVLDWMNHKDYEKLFNF